MTPSSLLELIHAHRTADDGRVLLEDVSLTIKVGDRIAVRGPSAAGKTLLLRALAALDPYAGDLRFRERPVPPQQLPRFRSQVIYVAQTPVFPPGRVEDALREPFHWEANQTRVFNRQEATSLCERLGRQASFLDQPTSELSGGEASVSAIVRALLLEPAVLLLDEPTSAMDPDTLRRFEACLGDWVARQDRAYVWVTHQADQAARIANRSLELAAGRILNDERLL